MSSSDSPPGGLGPAIALAVLIFLLPSGFALLWIILAPWLPIHASFALIEIAGILIPTLLLARGSRAALRWRPAPRAAVLWAMVAAAGLAGILSYAQTLWQQLTGFGPQAGLEEILEIRGPGDAAWLLLGAVLLPAFAEESAFRGFIQSRLERFGPALAIASTAILFALFHHDAYGVPTYLVMGAFLGYAAWRSGSIWPAAAAHATNNSLALLQANGFPEAWWWERVAILLPVAVLLAVTGLWRLVRSA